MRNYFADSPHEATDMERSQGASTAGTRENLAKTGVALSFSIKLFSLWV
jgi:hypothetical protein